MLSLWFLIFEVADTSELISISKDFMVEMSSFVLFNLLRPDCIALPMSPKSPIFDV